MSHIFILIEEGFAFGGIFFFFFCIWKFKKKKMIWMDFGIC